MPTMRNSEDISSSSDLGGMGAGAVTLAFKGAVRRMSIMCR